MKKPKISVVGLGFVGLPLAVVNSKKGFDTVGIDIDKKLLEKLRAGKPGFYEPNLKNYLKKSLKTKKITFTENLKQLLKTDITFLTVGTPSTLDGKIDLSQLKDVISQISKLLKKKDSKHLIVVKSTVTPTTTLQFILPAFKNLKNVIVVVNPEFLREGNAIKDLLDPHLIVIGEAKRKDGEILERYYKLFYKKLPEILRTEITTAEMIKYSNNAFLATKVSFINSIANICQSLPMVDVTKVAYAIGRDPRIGPLFLNPGPGFGGSCLPKDLTALIELSGRFGKPNLLLKAVKQVNQLQPMKIIQLLSEMNLLRSNKIIAILGLAFKKNTDDIRGAVSISVVKYLIKKGIRVRVHDPVAIKNFKRVFGNKINYCNTVTECLRNADCCVLLTEWDDYKELKPISFSKNMKNPNIIDARRILNPSEFSRFNFKAVGLGPKFVSR